MKYTLLIILAICFVGCKNESEKKFVMYQDSSLKVTKYFGTFNKRNYWLHVSPSGEVFADTVNYSKYLSNQYPQAQVYDMYIQLRNGQATRDSTGRWKIWGDTTQALEILYQEYKRIKDKQ